MRVDVLDQYVGGLRDALRMAPYNEKLLLEALGVQQTNELEGSDWTGSAAAGE